MSESQNLTVLQLNDSHGYLELHQELFWAGDHPIHKFSGGYARIATIIQEERDKNPDRVLFFDCGDTIHGTYAPVKSKGESLIPILNHLDFDAMTAHWEFAYGPKQFKKVVKKLNYPMLAINCYYKTNNKLVFDPYILIEVSNLRIGVIGIAATIVDKVMPPHFSEGIFFTLGNKELPYYVKKLREEEKSDLIILISHLGLPQEVKLAQEVDGIDIILSSHTHNRLYEPIIINKTIIIQSGCHGSFIGKLDLEIKDSGIKRFKHRLITVLEEINPGNDVNEIVEKVMDPHRDKLDQIVGYTKTALNRNTIMESTMDNLLLQSLIEVSQTDIAFSNGWRYGAPIPPGPITINDLWNIIPVNPPLSTVEITGRELWIMMEENLERTFSPDPYKQMGGYVKRCMGINIYFKVENPNYHRIQEFFVGGKHLEPNKRYKVSFVTLQGVPSKYGKNHSYLDINAVDALKRYLYKNKKIKADLKGTIVPI